MTMIGRTLSRYTIEASIGKGGMGEVFQARDTRLGRIVAIKVLPDDTDEDRVRRFMVEAKAASALNHPNIVTVHDVDQDGSVHFIVMEKIDGSPLSESCGTRMPLGLFLDVAIQISGALGAAHAAGIVHRDVKPANVMLSDFGVVKVVDFGLARLALQQVEPDQPTVPGDGPYTAPGVILGTIGYMSPEQVQGLPATARSDVFSLGVVFHELLSGTKPFQAESPVAVIASILRDTPPRLDATRSDLPDALVQLVARCLTKDPADRFASAAELHAELLTIREGLREPVVEKVRRPRWHLAVATGLAVLAIGVALLWWRQESRERWVRDFAVPEVERLLEVDDPVGAYMLVRRARDIAPNDVMVQQLWTNYTRPLTFRSEPAGAEVSMRNFVSGDDEWFTLGRTPIEDVPIPFGLVRYRVTLDGYVPIETAPEFEDEAFFRLHRPHEIPDGMVAVDEGPARFGQTVVTLPAFWIDRFEVTNGDYKRFVDSGGYQNREFWTEPFVGGGVEIPRDVGMAHLVDTTGRPGPSGWELGAFADGTDDHPVEGISWYEAMAYARFVGKDLPTVFHWKRAAAHGGIFSDMVAHSNFAGKGTAPVGSYGGLGAWGTWDMAGNVKEWCSTSSGLGRYTLGGSWFDASHQFTDLDAQPPFDRSAGFGMRLVRYLEPPDDALMETIPKIEPRRLEPVDDATFAVFRRLFDYDPRPLKERVEAVDRSHAHWRKEKVTFDAPYGGQRMTAYLFLPSSARTPYQSIVYFPGSDATYLSSSRELWLRMFEFHIRAGRAVVYPVYQGTYERRVDSSTGPQASRDLVTQRTMDARRTIDYLESRSDFDPDRIVYYGVSLGANMAPFILSTEPRFRGGIIFGGGIHPNDHAPELVAQHYLPRVTMPILFLGGRNDFAFPLESSQRPFFDLLGTPPDAKRQFVFEGGHLPVHFHEPMREMLTWCDDVLGPVPLR